MCLWMILVLLAIPPILGTIQIVTNREESADFEDVTPKEDTDITIHTYANGIIHLNCSDLELYKGDTVEIITDDSHWFYNSSFDMHGNSILMRFRTPSGKGKYYCTVTVEVRHGGFHIDPNCFCGRRHFDPKDWGKGLPPGRAWRGHGRPLVRHTRMVNGYVAHGKALHYVMSVLLNGTTPYCGATVVSKNVAVTSAFCLQNRNVSDPNYILMGNYSFQIDKNVTKLKDWRIIKMISHPKYNGSYANNIAVVMFNSSVDIFGTKSAFPACLPINIFGNLYGRWYTVLGWGSAKKMGPPEELLHGNPFYELIPVENCQAVYNFSGNATENEHSICLTNDGSDVCGIDSGGPVFYGYQNSQHVYLVGIIGESSNCDSQHPTMHTNVTHYLDWLSTILNEEGQTVCVK